MHILNIDLDFFMEGSVTGGDHDLANRPDQLEVNPWAAKDVVDFLENKLSIGRKNCGNIVTDHDEVFYLWKKLIESEKLSAPFNVTHVDAHADLGLGFDLNYLHTDFLSLPLAERPDALRGDKGINLGSYLSFAVGCRWISGIDFVVNRNWSDDIPRWILSEKSFELIDPKLSPMPYDNYQLEIELKQIDKANISTLNSDRDFFNHSRTVGEPIVPLNIITTESIGKRFADREWDFVFLSHSPGYVPSFADHLLSVVGSYIEDC
jgi:hypothetical protein